MPASINRFCLFCVLVSTLLTGCSKPPEPPKVSETVTIPIPTELENADPLISQLVSRTAIRIKNEPYNPENWAAHASALLANAYFEESIKTSQILIRRWPDFSPKLKYRQAIAQWRLNQQTLAISELSSLMEENSDYDCGWRLLAKWQLEFGDFEKATVAIQKAIALNPGLVGVDATYAQILLQDRNAAAAIAMIEPKLNHEDTPPYMYFLAGQAYRQLGESEAMQSVIEKSLPVPDQWPDPWLNEIAIFATGKKKVAEHALALLDMKEYKKALPFLKQALVADPENTNIRAGLAYVLMESNQLDKAQKTLEEIPNQEQAVFTYWLIYAEVAIALASNGQSEWYSKALVYYSRVVELAGPSPEIYKSMAMISEELKNHDRAADYILEGVNFLIEKNKIQEAKLFLREGLVITNQNDRLNMKLMELVGSQ